MDIITKRPEGMPFDEYKRVRASSNASIRNYLKSGRVYYLASQIIDIRNDFGKAIG